MNLENLKLLFADNGCQKIYIKKLAANDNSKNQVYFGGSFEILNILPITEIINEPAGDWEKERFKAKIIFSWISEEGNLYPAPNSQLILYPKYPEVRFSGFLARCLNPPSGLMTQRLPGRLLFFSVAENGTVLGYVTGPESQLANQVERANLETEHGVFKIIELPQVANNRARLLAELLRINRLGWVNSKRLDRNRNVLPCRASNCGGYTLEAELGITPNGYSEPDYLGWEVKQFSTSVITLMTPEPNSGFYTDQGTEAFIRTYGYADLRGRQDRMNFGGIYRVGQRNARTNLQLTLIGFDAETGRIRNTDGKITLLDTQGNEAASWDFTSMLQHWNRKHNQACYVPSKCDTTDGRRYSYGSRIILGTGTDFQLFLTGMSLGNIYYDPGIKLENASTFPEVKKRSQFRIRSRFLGELYHQHEIINLLE